MAFLKWDKKVVTKGDFFQMRGVDSLLLIPPAKYS